VTAQADVQLPRILGDVVVPKSGRCVWLCLACTTRGRGEWCVMISSTARREKCDTTLTAGGRDDRLIPVELVDRRPSSAHVRCWNHFFD